MKPWDRIWGHVLRVLLLLLFLGVGGIGAAEGAERIIFIPHDNRPISMQQTAEVAEQAGCELLMPPEELLSRGVDEPGDPEALWEWLEENAASAKAAVIATDSMLYGGLIPSRKHGISGEEISGRVAGFRTLHAAHPGLSLYLFGSLMRTPRSGLYAGSEEPGYYSGYGADIFRYTALADKAETGKLSGEERAEMERAKASIPPDALADWMGRREKNLSATKQLMEMAKEGVLRCFILGRDDNAPFSQTHKENRELHAYAEKLGIPESRFRSMAGIDEFNLLLLTRAVNDLRNEIPFVHVIYNEGKGADTIPSYSDEPIGNSIRESVALAGGMMIPRAERADFVLLVNTDPKGRTGEASDITPNATPLVNDGKNRRGSAHFFNAVRECVEKGYPTGVADIAFANGADNALMEDLRKAGLLEKLRAYSGWNTGTNSSGFALGTGMLSGSMTEAGRKRLLVRRYLDDWAYQANVRTAVSLELWEEGRGEVLSRLDGARAEMEERAGHLLREFARENLSSFQEAREAGIRFPWNRMFECALEFPLEFHTRGH